MLRRLTHHTATILITVLLGGFLTATLARFSPGFGVDEEELDARRSAASLASLRQANAADQNVIDFYVRYLARTFRGDFGTSRTLNRPVAELVRERLPETLQSVTVGLLLGWLLGFVLAVPVAMFRSWLFDIAASVMAGLLLCVPAAVLALLFVLLRAPGRLVIGLIVFPKVFRYARNLLVRTAELPHVLSARARGLRSSRIFLWHVVPNAGPQLLALAGVSVSLAFTAVIPVEVLCDLPGIGQLAWKAALGRDLPLLVTLTMIVTVVTLVANSAADLLRPRWGEA
jgi:peptide/nickel transport system permease protein